jgi:hypothetical protein
MSTEMRRRQLLNMWAKSVGREAASELRGEFPTPNADTRTPSSQPNSAGSGLPSHSFIGRPMGVMSSRPKSTPSVCRIVA